MNGLIYKEICMFKSQFKSWIFAFAILIGYGFILNSMSILLVMTALMGVLSCLTTFTYDKTYRCDEYVAAMPLSRKKIVVSKYVFLLLLDLALTFSTGLVVAMLSPFFNEDLWSVVPSALGVLGATVFLQAVLLPIIYTWGPEKARFALVITGVTPYILLMLLKGKAVDMEPQFWMNLLKAAPFILVTVIGISLYVSVKVYKKKDL